MTAQIRPTGLIAAPLQGEILGVTDRITVIAALHPLSPARDVLSLPSGLSLREIVDTVASRSRHGRYSGGLCAWIETDPVPPALWGSVRVKGGTRVVLRAVPQGGGGGILKSLALLAVAVLSAFVAPYLTPFIGSTLATITAAAVAVAGSLLVNALFPVDTRKDKGKVYSIAGNQNLAARYEPIPFTFGRMRVYPRYGASAYTEIVGADQFLILGFDWGYGPLDITDLKLAETPLSAYRDVQIETGYGYSTDPASTIYPSTVVQKDESVELKAVDGWTLRTTAEDCIAWSIDLVAPNGLSRTEKTSGKMVAFAVDIEIQQSVAYAEDWQPVEVVHLQAAKNITLRREVERLVARGQYDIRLRRLTPDTDEFPNVVSNVGFTAIRSFRSEPPISFKKATAKTWLRIKANSQLSGMIDNLNGIVVGRGKGWDGTVWQADIPSQWPPDAMVRLLQGPGIARPVPDSRIDWPTFQAWHAHCVLKGWKYNKVHVERRAIRAAAQDIASAGRAAVVFRDGKWSVVWDDPDAPIVQHFTPRNSRGFRVRRQYRRLPHALRVKFLNEHRGWREDEVVVYRQGYDVTNATLFETAEFPGITDHVLATRHGYFHLAQLEYRPDEIFLEVDIEAMICTRGDRVRVSHSVPSWGIASGRVVAVAGRVVWLDEEITMEAGKVYSCRFRSPDGFLLREIVTLAGTTNSIVLAGEGEVPAEGELAMFGETGLDSVVLRVKTITGAANLAANLILVADAPEIAEADGRPVPPVVDPTGPLDGRREPTVSGTEEGLSSAGGTASPNATLYWSMARAIPAIARFEVALKAPGAAEFGGSTNVVALQRRYTFEGLAAGIYGLRVRAIYADGTVSSWETTEVTLLGWSRPPEDVQGLTVAHVGTLAVFGWTAPQRQVARLELRRATATSGATWDTATLVDSRADGTALAVPFATGTYFARFVNGGGVYSTNPVALVVTSASADVQLVGEIYDMAPFEGAHVNTVEASGAVRLAPAAGVLPASGSYTPSQVLDFGLLSTVTLSANGLVHGVDLSAGTAGAPDIYGIDETSWRATLEISKTLDVPTSPTATWSAWAEFFPGEVTARAARIRARLESRGADISPAVELLSLRADATPRNEVSRNISVPSTGLVIAYGAKFLTDPAVVVTIRNPGSGDRVVINARTLGGFTVQVFNSAGTAAARIIDFIASGYGRSS